MDAATLRTVTIVCLVSLLFLWFFASFMVRVAGVWMRTDEPVDRERVTFTQFGPYVQGKAVLEGGGRREYSGFIFGRTLRLTRRDHGVRALELQGFPREIAPLVDGRVTAKLKMRVGRDALEGRFFPHKISYTLQPPRVKGMVVLASTARVYRRENSANDAVEAVDFFSAPASTN